MLHYCRIEDITAGIQVAPRFITDLRGIRDIVTHKINSFIRRDLGYAAGVVEFFTTPKLSSSDTFNIWLEKKAVVIASLGIVFSTTRAWDDADPLLAEQFVLDAVNGKITVYGYLPKWPRGLRVTYDGGYPPLEADPEVMACPEGLRHAAAQQCIYEARRALSGDQGTTTDDDKKTPVRMMGELLYDTASAFLPYRRPLGR